MTRPAARTRPRRLATRGPSVHSPAVRTTAVLAALLIPLVIAAPGDADDRDLLRRGQQDPYVFVILDVSGSMNQSVPCTAEDAAAGFCQEVCPPGACLPRMVGDDPDSRMRVAKEAIFEIMEQTENVHFGFASFDQDGLRVRRKHWWYRLADSQPDDLITLDSGRLYPGPGHEEIFGETWSCTLGFDGRGRAFEPERFIGCFVDRRGRFNDEVFPADLDDPWESERVRRWPKLDDDNDTDRTYFIRDTDGQVYAVTFEPVSGQVLGAPQVQAEVTVERCQGRACGTRTLVGSERLVWEKADEMIYWEPGEGIFRTPPGEGFFGPFGGTRQVGQQGSNTGMDLNSDTGEDIRDGRNLRAPTLPDPFRAEFLNRFGRERGQAFTLGDIIPLDWKSDQRRRIQERMAPNLTLGEITPDFQVATYFEDHPNGDGLALVNDAARPLIPNFGTPTGRSMEEFRKWFADWLEVATDSDIGDPDLACRSFNLVVVTDGLASDGDSACGHANQLRNFAFQGEHIPVRSFAVALGNPELRVPSFNNVLDCIADNGGSGATDHDGDGEPDGPGPLFPQNKQQLIDSFRQIFELITTRTRSFAAAAVPQAQANTQDKIFLTSFTPVPDSPVWAGRIDAYLRPIPLKEVQVTTASGTVETRLVPNRDRDCTGPDPSGCRLWDAGEELVARAPVLAPPNGSPLTAQDLKIGPGAAERQVFFAHPTGPSVPEDRRFFAPPGTDAGWQDLLADLGICDPTAADFATCAQGADERGDAERIFRLLYGRKTFRNPENAQVEPYVLGDIFHSNPRVLSGPDNFQYFLQDFFGNGQPCSASGGTRNRGYQCFFARHRFRRNVLLVAANDGQVHAFDAGIFERQGATLPVQGDYDDGTGRELFSFVPRSVFPDLRALTDPNAPPSHRFLLDGSLVTTDVFIDPDHAGVPTASDREWRTVAVGGLREGGAGYYALDLTQPDTVTSADDFVPAPAANRRPSCLTGGTDCGPVPYPTPLWELRDARDCRALAQGRCDDDPADGGGFGDGRPDLADSWSVPNVGMIEICDGATCDPSDPDDVVRRFVSVFGGGLDAEKKNADVQGGNWLYMADVETGQVLYKRRLVGSAPSNPAAVDTDQDGILDTIYIGTVKGLLYKVDLSRPVPVNPSSGRITDLAWEPFPIFTTDGRPIYFPPAVIFVAERGRFALAFGTGDREDLWEESATDDGRFYLFVDDGLEPATPDLPLSQDNLRRVALGDGSVDTETDLLLLPGTAVPSGPNAPRQPVVPRSDVAGWFLELGDDERVITQAFSLGGVTVFSTFIPTLETSVLLGEETVCANRGASRVYVLFTNNANPVFDTGERFRVVPDLVTEPFSEVGQIKNPPPSGDDPTADDLSDNLEQVMESLKTSFPDSCRFANFTINIKALRSDTGVEFIAPVPVCITQRNWKEN